MLTEHTDTMEGLLTHVATADCFITLPHPTLECGIVTAWWRSQVQGEGEGEGDAPMRRRESNGNLRNEDSARSPEGG